MLGFYVFFVGWMFYNLKDFIYNDYDRKGIFDIVLWIICIIVFGGFDE